MLFTLFDYQTTMSGSNIILTVVDISKNEYLLLTCVSVSFNYPAKVRLRHLINNLIKQYLPNKIVYYWGCEQFFRRGPNRDYFASNSLAFARAVYCSNNYSYQINRKKSVLALYFGCMVCPKFGLFNTTEKKMLCLPMCHSNKITCNLKI